MSPVGAHGGCCAIESVAALVNSLTQHLHLYSGEGANNETIQSIFETYQKTREARVRNIAGTANFMTRLGTWDNFMMKFVGQHVLPWLNDTTLISGLVKDAVKVDFLPVPRRSKGFSDQTGEVDLTIQKNSQRLLKWKVVLYSAMGLIACAILLALRDWRKLHNIGTVGFVFSTTRSIS